MSLFGKKDTPNPQEQPTAGTPVTPPRPAPPVPESRPSAPPAAQQRVSQTLLGVSLTIKGDVTADENITIEGTVEGTVQTSRDVTVAPDGRVKATIRGATVTISGKVRGNVEATNKVDLTSTGQLEGNIHAPKLSIAESALFKGSIDMSAPGAARTETRDADKK